MFVHIRKKQYLCARHYKRITMMQIGLTHRSSAIVSAETTAIHIGSGDMAVWATPAMLSLMENAAMLAVRDALAEGETTVGGHIESSHLRPSTVGAHVYAIAELTAVEGRKLHFRVAAFQQTAEGNVLLGEGTHLRFIVEREKFLQKTI